MIVVDTNVIAHLFIASDFTAAAQEIVRRDSDWIAPILWRSEFRNILANYLRVERISLRQARFAMRKAEDMMRGGEYEVESNAVLALVAATQHSAYDCEFVVLARQQGRPLVTADQRLLRVFPDETVSMTRFLEY